MSAATKKPPVPGASARPPPNAGQTTRSPSRNGASNNTASTSTTPGGVTRTRSVRNGLPSSARAAVRKPGGTSNLASSATQDEVEDAKAESAAIIQELKEQLAKTEAASEEYRRQVEMLNERLDEAHKDQATLEEKVHEEEERVEGLENDKKETIRQRRELESIYEAERVSFMKQKDEAQAREDELTEIIQRLKDGQGQGNRDLRPGTDDDGRLSRNSSFRNSAVQLENGQFAPGSVQRSNSSRNDSKQLYQKDQVIEGLRLELAEVQIKLVEMENQGGGRVQELEKMLLETRMANARLMEDNESFQVLLSEKTMNGEFAKGDFMREAATLEDRQSKGASQGVSLADELETAEDIPESEHVRRVEAENRQLKEQVRALTLYVENIVSRVLLHKGYESILDKNNLDGGPAKPDTDKELPPPPPPKENVATSFLQRAKSIAIRATSTEQPAPTETRKARPISYAAAPTSDSMPPPPRVTEDPNTAPSVPLQRVNTARQSGHIHRRSNSEWPAAGIVNNMYRGSSGQISPAMTSPRNSFFGPNALSTGGSNPPSRTASGNVPHAQAGSEQERSGAITPSDSTASYEANPIGLDTPSPPRSVASSDRPSGGAIMSGKGPRPLRLVQEAKEQDDAEMRARKQANRGSWISGWFNKPPENAMSPQ